jgi:membrane associated rhomboid family serine protease
MISMTYLLIAFTALVSIPAFKNHEWFSRLQFNAYQAYHRREVYRLLTHGFLHANWMHLLVNMFVLFFFGPVVEQTMQVILGPGLERWYRMVFLLFYFLGIVIASLMSLYKHREDPWYNSVGASGAVSAVIFFYIFFNPWEMMYIYGILPVPGIILGVLYLAYSHFMSHRGTDNVNHDAHLIGALFGFIFPLIINFRLIGVFLDRLLTFPF